MHPDGVVFPTTFLLSFRILIHKANRLALPIERVRSVQTYILPNIVLFFLHGLNDKSLHLGAGQPKSGIMKARGKILTIIFRTASLQASMAGLTSL